MAGGLVGGIAGVAVCAITVVFFKRRFCRQASSDKQQNPDVIDNDIAEEERTISPPSDTRGQNIVCKDTFREHAIQPQDDPNSVECTDRNKYPQVDEMYSSIDIEKGTLDVMRDDKPQQKGKQNVRELNVQVNKMRKAYDKGMNGSCQGKRERHAHVNKQRKETGSNLDQPLFNIDVTYPDHYDHVQGDSAQISVNQQSSYDHIFSQNTTIYDQVEIEDTYDKLKRRINAGSKPMENKEDEYNILQRSYTVPSNQRGELLEENYDYAEFSSDY